jgi:hypothetical protein
VIRDLSERDITVIGQCLACVATGEVIANDGEFQTLFGIEFATLERIASAWPRVDTSDSDVVLAVSGSLGNLLGYPHGKDARMRTHMSVSRTEITSALENWRKAIDHLPAPGVAQ